MTSDPGSLVGSKRGSCGSESEYGRSHTCKRSTHDGLCSGTFFKHNAMKLLKSVEKASGFCSCGGSRSSSIGNISKQLISVLGGLPSTISIVVIPTLNSRRWDGVTELVVVGVVVVVVVVVVAVVAGPVEVG
eukprot:TRINITY_DN4207_c1_g1_i5.p1 TRINITY_DN4207_c1_g1~~TRINITY_DN4207_c1_g1_i5.p1  ORF type:complete len:132 (+),score=23.75 TRINITY_DN4207_c1_g1_i5:111-506(+)